MTLKTDWRMSDTVLPQDFNKIGEEVNSNTANIATNTNNIANNTNELNKIKDSVVNNKPIVLTDDTPIGTIVWYSSNNMSQIDTDCWKWCNGQSLNKSDYAEAYSVLRSIYGGTDTTFNLPNLMQDNLFIRAALENGTNTGHSQLDTIKSHNSILVNTIGEATMISNIGATHPTNTAHTIVINNGSLVTNHMPPGIDYNTNPNNRHLIAEATYNGATETRPKNVSMIPLIKIKSRSKDMISVAQEWEKFKSTDASLDNYYGYQKLPSGLIIQWGTVWLPDTNQRYSQKDFSFPIAFPQECLGVFADGARNNNAWFDLNATAVDLSLTSCRVMCAHINPGSTLSGQTKVYWFAIGR